MSASFIFLCIALFQQLFTESFPMKNRQKTSRKCNTIKENDNIFNVPEIFKNPAKMRKYHKIVCRIAAVQLWYLISHGARCCPLALSLDKALTPSVTFQITDGPSTQSASSRQTTIILHPTTSQSFSLCLLNSWQRPTAAAASPWPFTWTRPSRPSASPHR